MTDATAELVPCFEGPLAQMRELERQLTAQDIEVELAKPPAKACCGGSCGCSSKLQLLVHKEDLQKVAQLMQQEWLDAVEREGKGGLVQLGTPVAEGQEPPCPACGFVGALVEGACGDCGLQLE
ncbi:MAG: hypothetical protein U0228_37235 [Myxococcaceae bacterium]